MGKFKKEIKLLPMRSDERLAEKIAREILPRYQTKHILDVGCGDGIVGETLTGKNITYKGIDIKDASIYEQKPDNPNISYLPAEKIGEEVLNSTGVDMILLLDIIEHTREFTKIFQHALTASNKYVVVSLPNELFFADRIRMFLGKELNAHSLDLLGRPEGFKHQYIINIEKARGILESVALENNYALTEEYARPLIAKQKLLRFLPALARTLSSQQFWSMGSIFIFTRVSQYEDNN